MIKAKLRELEMLQATCNMVNKAKKRFAYKKRVSKWTGVKYIEEFKKTEYRYYARCQQYEDILKISLYLAPSLRENDTIPLYEIFIDIVKKQYITRELDINGEEIGWYTSGIENISKIHLNWNEKIYIDKESENTAKKALGTYNDFDFYQALRKYQSSVRRYKREMAWKRETDRWDSELSVTPELPKDWIEWCKDKLDYTYMFYEAGTKEATCCMCGKTVVVPEIKNNMEYECPNCDRKGTIYVTGRIPRYLRTDYINCHIIQEIPDGYVVREFCVRMSINEKKYTEPYIYNHEYKRLIYRNGNFKEYSHELYKTKEIRWCENHVKYNRCYSQTKRDYTYTANLKKIHSKALLQSSIALFVKSYRGRCDAYDYAVFENTYPWYERVYKAGIKTLARELLERYYEKSVIDGKQTELTRMLKIDKGLLRRLRENNGGITYLKFLQTEYETKRHYDDDVIREFCKKSIDPEDIHFIADRMAPRAILNYLSKQAEKMNETMYRTCTKWSDYLNMAKKAKMQVQTEQIYRPKNLAAAHAMVIAILESKKIETQIKEIRKKWKNVEKHCQELTKYEYSDDNFAIVAPRNVKDIFIEGMTLSHCIHTCDFYFERINNKESYLLFLRKKSDIEASWYTLEVEPSGNIRQKSTVGDNLYKDFDEAIPFIKKWQKEIQKRLTKEDKKLAKKSEELRIQNYANLRKNKNRIWHGVLQGKLLVDVLEDRFMAAE